jgi:CRISPR/Cas system-associated exonuclease Cas4 (RecB family)
MNPVLAALRDADHVSVSSIKSYLLCPQKHHFRYSSAVEPSHRSIPLVMGKAVHDSLESFYHHLQKHGDDPPVELLLDTFTTSWHRAALGDPPVRSDDIGKDMDQGVGLVQAFYDQAPRPKEVLGVEDAFALELIDDPQGRLIVGAIDAVVVDQEDRVVVVESKTAARRWPAVQLEHDFQVSVYQLAARSMDLHAPVLRYDFLLKLKKPVLESVEVHRTPQQEQEALHIFKQVMRAVDSGIYFPIRGWMCAGCEYGHAC